MTKIKTPVRYDAMQQALFDADENMLAALTPVDIFHSDFDDAWNQIADALNRTADLEAIKTASIELWCGLQEAIALCGMDFERWCAENGNERIEACRQILDSHQALTTISAETKGDDDGK